MTRIDDVGENITKLEKFNCRMHSLRWAQAATWYLRQNDQERQDRPNKMWRDDVDT